jgi:hypothetical protein
VRILLDACIPERLARFIEGHDVVPALLAFGTTDVDDGPDGVCPRGYIELGDRGAQPSSRQLLTNDLTVAPRYRPHIIAVKCIQHTWRNGLL